VSDAAAVARRAQRDVKAGERDDEVAQVDDGACAIPGDADDEINAASAGRRRYMTKHMPHRHMHSRKLLALAIVTPSNVPATPPMMAISAF
jgi:hypothetical protein